MLVIGFDSEDGIPEINAVSVKYPTANKQTLNIPAQKNDFNKNPDIVAYHSWAKNEVEKLNR